MENGPIFNELSRSTAVRSHKSSGDRTTTVARDPSEVSDDPQPPESERGPCSKDDREGEAAASVAPLHAKLTRRQWQQLVMIGLIGVSLAAFVVAEIYGSPHGGRTVPEASGISYFEVSSWSHVTAAPTMYSVPPVGGDHAEIWQTCGFYEGPVATEAAIHSLEHGAVWIAYRQDLAANELDVLRRVSAPESKLLVSMWEGELPAPMVASAWGVQRAVMSASDPALSDFVRRFAGSPRSPGHDAPCSGGQR